MSQISDLAADVYRSAAQMAFQSNSRLRSRVFEIPNVVGKRQDFPIFGSGDSTERSSQSEITPANLGNAQPWATLKPIEWFDLIDRQDQVLTNVDAARPAGMVAGKACGRKIDNHIIDALKSYDSTAYSRDGLTAGLFVKSGTAQQLTSKGLREAASVIMDETDNEDVELTVVMPATVFQYLADDERLISFDFLQQARGQDNVTATAKFYEIYGMVPILIGQNARRDGHGKLPANRAYVFDKNCVGLATSTLDRMGVMEWVPMRRSVLVGAETKAGATRINNSGIVEIRFEA